jgi:5-methylcytosine-specific restriction protein A
MMSDPDLLAEWVSAETGIEFTGAEGHDSDGNRWMELYPAGHSVRQTFILRTVVGWRRVDVFFRLGDFARELVEAMGSADSIGRQTFRAVLTNCREAGAEVKLTINGAVRDVDDDTVWALPWRSFDLAIQRGMLDINEGNADSDLRQIELWTSRAAAAVLALLPLEAKADDLVEVVPDVAGLPEGAKVRIEVNRYERDRRNRAATLAIHGYRCKACGVDMSERYGWNATGLIEVHHVVPVSEIGSCYVVNPKTDLVPLCPNCHSVAHRRPSPFSVDDLRHMLGLV